MQSVIRDKILNLLVSLFEYIGEKKITTALLPLYRFITELNLSGTAKIGVDRHLSNNADNCELP